MLCRSASPIYWTACDFFFARWMCSYIINHCLSPIFLYHSLYHQSFPSLSRTPTFEKYRDAVPSCTYVLYSEYLTSKLKTFGHFTHTFTKLIKLRFFFQWKLVNYSRYVINRFTAFYIARPGLHFWKILKRDSVLYISLWNILQQNWNKP